MTKYPNATASQIAEIAERSELDSFCSPTSDDCTLVAQALNHIFDIDSYYVATEPAQKYSRPSHIAVIKNGTIIDANGILNEECMRSYAVSGLKKHEIERADCGPVDTSLFEKNNLGEQDSQLFNDIKREIKDVSEKVL